MSHGVDKLKVGSQIDSKKKEVRDVNQALAAKDAESKSKASSDGESEVSKAKTFTFAQLEAATENFNSVLGEGGFGKVYKGKLQDSGQVNSPSVCICFNTSKLCVRRLLNLVLFGFLGYFTSLIFAFFFLSFYALLLL